MAAEEEGGKGQLGRKRVLVAFDFDQTMVDDNTDTFFLRLLSSTTALPPSVMAMRASAVWTDYMAAVLEHAHSVGISSQALRECLCSIPWTAGMLDLLGYLTEKRDQVEAIIISDSNSLFIPWILETAGFLHLFADQHSMPSHTLLDGEDFGRQFGIYTNPAWLDTRDRIHLQYYHHNTWCSLSAKNMCKGAILSGHVNPGGGFIPNHPITSDVFDHVIFVGDGSNDFCPATILRPHDCLAARRGHRLPGLVEKNPDKVVSKVLVWDDARQLVNLVESFCG